MTFDAIVVGGGIVGSACAFYLSLDGRRVALVEPGPLGGGTTAAGMGHVVAMDDSDAQLSLTRYSQTLWQELAGELSAACEDDACGTLWVAANEEEASFLPGKQEVYARFGIPTEILDERTVREAEPQLRPGLAGGLRIPEDSVVYPMAAAKWLAERAMDRGAQLIQKRATRVNGRTVVLEDGSVLESEMVVNAAGAHAPDLTSGLEIEPRKGHLVITDRYPNFVRHQLVELGYLKSAHSTGGDSVAFNVQPRKTGQLLIGSSRQYAGWEKEVDRAIVGRMMRRALEFMPGLGELSTARIWTGFRPATPDKMPLIGPWPGEEGLYIAAGHEGLGITTALGTGRMIADMVAGRAPAISPAPYLPGRVVAHS